MAAPFDSPPKLTWLSILRPATSYLFQSSENLRDWQTVRSFTTTNQMLLPMEADLDTTGGKKFFRVIEAQ